MQVATAFTSHSSTCWKTACAAAALASDRRKAFCKCSQFQHLTECSRQHTSPTTPKTHDFKKTPATKGWSFALMPPWASKHIQYPRTPKPAKEGVGSPKAPQTTTTRQQDTNTLLNTYTFSSIPLVSER